MGTGSGGMGATDGDMTKKEEASSPSKTMKASKKPFGSPSKKTAKSLKLRKLMTKGEDDGEKCESGLKSPTSINMQSTFIIKNADESFDAYYH